MKKTEEFTDCSNTRCIESYFQKRPSRRIARKLFCCFTDDSGRENYLWVKLCFLFRLNTEVLVEFGDGSTIGIQKILH